MKTWMKVTILVLVLALLGAAVTVTGAAEAVATKMGLFGDDGVACGDDLDAGWSAI